MGERVVWRGRRGTVVIGCDRWLSDQEFHVWAQAWARVTREPRGVAVLAPGMHVEAVIPYGAGRSRRGYRPRWAR